MPSLQHEQKYQTHHRKNENKHLTCTTTVSPYATSRVVNPILRYSAEDGKITKYTDFKTTRPSQNKTVNKPPSMESSKSSSDVSIRATLVQKPDTKAHAHKETQCQSQITNGAKNDISPSPGVSPSIIEKSTAETWSTPKPFPPRNNGPFHEAGNLNQQGNNCSGQSPSFHSPRKHNYHGRNSMDNSERRNDKSYTPKQNGFKNLSTNRGSSQRLSQNKSNANQSSEENSMLSPGQCESPTFPENREDEISIRTEIGSISTDVEFEQLENEKEKIRAIQGKDPALEHFDFSGTRMPPPCDWESGRPRFDNSFMNSYIEEWRGAHGFEPGPTGFETSDDWRGGKFHVQNYILVSTLVPEDSNSTSDETGTVNVGHTQKTTSKVANHQASRHENKPSGKSKTNQNKIQARPTEVVQSGPENNSFSPKIQMYLRPAVIDDSEQVAQIYNKHIAEGNITEDQEPILVDDAMHLIKNNKKEKLPFIVAIAGRCPLKLNENNSRKQKQKLSMPKNEKIIGFAFNERFNYSFSGKTNGRSRYTTTIQVFVAHEYQGKGVGRNLLDRLIHMLSTAYGYQKACDFINPEGDEVHECEGSGMWHQIQFHVPVLKKNDPDYPRIKNFLFSNFLIREVCRMKSTGRTNVQKGPAKWLDTVIFQFEISQEGNFGPYS